MSTPEILFYALCLAFCQIEVLRFGSVKPLNCVKCMTGWYALTLGIHFQGWHGLFLLPAGVFVGSMFTAVKYRWL